MDPSFRSLQAARSAVQVLDNVYKSGDPGGPGRPGSPSNWGVQAMVNSCVCAEVGYVTSRTMVKPIHLYLELNFQVVRSSQRG